MARPDALRRCLDPAVAGGVIAGKAGLPPRTPPGALPLDPAKGNGLWNAILLVF